ncbi:archease [candidate division NPL-UPA2 bacterium]|nr:archease [candidate division NPL-UPA2 bacterium]
MTKAQREYEIVDHPADLGLCAFGETREELFANVARAMFDQLVDREKVETPLCRSLTVEAPNEGELLVRFLSELLYLFAAEEFLPGKFKIKRMDDQHLEADIGGEKFIPSRHQLKTEIKAVTYHNLKVDHDKTGWKAKVLFDV